jgi:ATP-dependent Clp protease adaptor protein ClpS
MSKHDTLVTQIAQSLIQNAAGDNDDDYTLSNIDDDGGLAIEIDKPALKKPNLYKVLLINDDYTPMGFVVQVLMQFFGLDESRASQVMLEVHQRGKAVCGIYPREIAETKVIQVSELARKNEHPLLCTMEEA